ncbi:MAG: hypothetical protein J6T10_21375 [Methanobrevibacter sp.]|nr:hypothetical protein [Methanobrevibacter sp.]
MPPITLNVNTFLGTLTNLVAYSQVADVAQRGSINRLVASCQNISVPNGDGKVIRHAGLPAVSNLSGTSSLLTNTPPVDTGEQYIPVTEYKVIAMTINNYLLRGAFVDENQMANFIAYLMKTMEVAKEAYIYKALVANIDAYAPTQATQTVTVNLIDMTGLVDPAQMQQANTYNTNAIVKAMIKVLKEMGAPTDDFNDLGVEEIIDNESLKLIINSRFDVDMLTDTFATLFNSGKLSEAQRWSETIDIPEGQLTTNPTTTIGWLCDREKFQFGYFYQVATSFFDGSTLDQRNWLHFAYYLDSVDVLPCVKFIADYTITPAALQ